MTTFILLPLKLFVSCHPSTFPFYYFFLSCLILIYVSSCLSSSPSPLSLYLFVIGQLVRRILREYFIKIKIFHTLASSDKGAVSFWSDLQISWVLVNSTLALWIRRAATVPRWLPFLRLISERQKGSGASSKILAFLSFITRSQPHTRTHARANM